MLAWHPCPGCGEHGVPYGHKVCDVCRARLDAADEERARWDGYAAAGVADIEAYLGRVAAFQRWQAAHG